MKFTYDAYIDLIHLLQKNGYLFVDYHTDANHKKTCILRHDVDVSIEKAYEMASIEAKMGVSSTYFVMTTSNLYNPFSKKNVNFLREIAAMGHEIGLHFDETVYNDADHSAKMKFAEAERDALTKRTGLAIRAISYHIPSQETLEADWKFDGMVNSYSKKFFHEYKYLSDSMRRWREPVLDIIKKGRYDKLHILTHPIWYTGKEIDLYTLARDFIGNANRERYEEMKPIIVKLEELLPLSESIDKK